MKSNKGVWTDRKKVVLGLVLVLAATQMVGCGWYLRPRCQQPCMPFGPGAYGAGRSGSDAYGRGGQNGALDGSGGFGSGSDLDGSSKPRFDGQPKYMLDTVYFDFDQSSIRPDQQVALQRKVSFPFVTLIMTLTATIAGAISMLCGMLFLMLTPKEAMAPAKRPRTTQALPRAVMLRIVFVMTATAVTANLIFNFTTNGNGELLRERFRGIVEDPATLGILLAAVYGVGSFAQLIVGRLIDKHPLKRLYLGIACVQVPLFALAAFSDGWALWALAIGFMAFVFGAIPFIDAMIVRYVDDAMRSRVTGLRLAIGLGVSSFAVWLLGPLVKASGFTTLLLGMAAISACTVAFIALLPGEAQTRPAPVPAPAE